MLELSYRWLRFKSVYYKKVLDYYADLLCEHHITIQSLSFLNLKKPLTKGIEGETKKNKIWFVFDRTLKNWKLSFRKLFFSFLQGRDHETNNNVGGVSRKPSDLEKNGFAFFPILFIRNFWWMNFFAVVLFHVEAKILAVAFVAMIVTGRQRCFSSSSRASFKHL